MPPKKTTDKKPVPAKPAKAPAKPKAAAPAKKAAAPKAPKAAPKKRAPKAAEEAPQLQTAPEVKAAPAVPAPAPKPVVAAPPPPPPAPKPVPAVQSPPPAPAPVAAAPAAPRPAPVPAAKKKVKIGPQATVKELAQLTGLSISDVIKKLMSLGVWATINQKLDAEVASLILSDAGFEVEKADASEEEDISYAIGKFKDDASVRLPRAPIVTVMGHVDHGKSSLLDAIRGTNVVAQESGGITQHIGAYKVKIAKGEVVFLDTPGHEAFTAMRARGAQVTDLVILVVAADDGVMPQTIEAIDHAKAGNVPIMVAINKIDKPEANANRVKQELANHGLQPEDWGGKTIMVEVSAKKKLNIDKLLEMVLLQAEVLELKANSARPSVGAVLEARKDPKMGNVASILVTEGTLSVGDPFVCGLSAGRVRALIGESGERLPKVGPSTPVAVLGFTDVPQAGDKFVGVQSEKAAREIANKRRMTFEALHGKTQSKHLTLEDLHDKIESGAVKELKVVLRADVQGSLEAIIGELSRLRHEEVVIKVLHSGVGDVTLGDVLLAAASDAIILAFHVGVDVKAAEEGKKENVQITQYSVIYELVGEIKAALEGLLAPIMRETVVGSAEVRNVFNITGSGVIAGCMVTQGKITRESLARIWRGSVKIFESRVTGLKRFKDDVTEVNHGYECGISVSGFKDIRKGDRIECYVQVKELKKLTAQA